MPGEAWRAAIARATELELEMMVDAGMKPMQVIVAATSATAEC